MSIDKEIVKPDCICIEHDNKKNNILNYFKEYKENLCNGENLIITKI
jgi:methylglyoxal synthase